VGSVEGESSTPRESEAAISINGTDPGAEERLRLFEQTLECFMDFCPTLVIDLIQSTLVIERPFRIQEPIDLTGD
jgi:hypothetical protein